MSNPLTNPTAYQLAARAGRGDFRALETFLRSVADSIIGTVSAALVGITAGIVTASKALVVDASRNLANLNNLSLTGLLAESAMDNVIAHAGGGQASAFQLSSELTRVATVASVGDSVKLPASAPGLTIIVENAATNAMQVFGAGTDQINGLASALGVSQMGGSVVIFTCYTAGNWFANGLGTGYSGSLESLSNASGITAFAAGGQGSATALATMMNTITTAASAGASVVLPFSTPGVQITVINNGANSINVFCPTGTTMNGTINASSALAVQTVGLYFCIAPGVWVSK